jgi:hypothetical protein
MRPLVSDGDLELTHDPAPARPARKSVAVHRPPVNVRPDPPAKHLSVARAVAAAAVQPEPESARAFLEEGVLLSLDDREDAAVAYDRSTAPWLRGLRG